jgi:hypothetical protein
MSGETTDDLSVDVAAQAAFNEGYAGIEAPTTTPEPAEQPVSKEAEPQQSPKPFSVSEDQWRNVEQQMAKLAIARRARSARSILIAGNVRRA